MICPFENCEMETELHQEPVAHLVVTLAPDGHPHVHGTIGKGDERWAEIMIIAIAKAAGIDLNNLAVEIAELEQQELSKQASKH